MISISSILLSARGVENVRENTASGIPSGSGLVLPTLSVFFTPRKEHAPVGSFSALTIDDQWQKTPIKTNNKAILFSLPEYSLLIPPE